MRTENESSLDGAHTVLIQGCRLVGPAGQIVIGVVLGVYRPAFQEVVGFIQHPGIPGAEYVAAGRQRQPEIVIRTMRTHAPA